MGLYQEVQKSSRKSLRDAAVVADMRRRMGVDRDPRHSEEKVPRDLSVTTGKLANNLAGINAKIPGGEFTKDRVSGAGQWTKGEISAAGTWGKGELPGDIQYGKIAYGEVQNTPDLSKFVKDEAIAGFQNRKQVQNTIRDMVKKGSLK